MTALVASHSRPLDFVERYLEVRAPELTEFRRCAKKLEDVLRAVCLDKTADIATVEELLARLCITKTGPLRDMVLPFEWPGKMTFTLAGDPMDDTDEAEVRCVLAWETPSSSRIANMNQVAVPRSMQRRFVKNLDADWKLFVHIMELYDHDIDVFPPEDGEEPRPCMTELEREQADEECARIYGDLSGVETLHLRLSGVDLVNWVIGPQPFLPHMLAEYIKELGGLPHFTDLNDEMLEALWDGVLFDIMPSLRKLTVSRDCWTIDDDSFDLREAIKSWSPGYIENGGTVSDWPMNVYHTEKYWPHATIPLKDYRNLLVNADRHMCATVNAWLDEDHEGDKPAQKAAEETSDCAFSSTD